MKLPSTTVFAQIRPLLAVLDSSDVEVIDASDLDVFDTSTVAFLLEARRRAGRHGARLEVRNAPPKLRQLAALYGAEDLLSWTER